MFGNHRRLVLTVSVLACLFFANAFVTQAALKDSDVDGITDEAETNVYRTDPNNHDTDGDGFDDGYEITNTTNPLDTNDAPFKTAVDVQGADDRRFRMSVFFAAVSASVIVSLGYVFMRGGKE